jgi:DNA-binding MarR family transcriptional regulator
MDKIAEKGFLKKEIFMIFTIAHELDLYRNKVLEPYGITGKQAVILSYLLRNYDKQLTQRDFEYHFKLCSSTINSVLNNLEKGGFLTRNISDTDGRAKNVTVTAKGREMSDVIMELFQNESDMVIQDFTKAEQAQFLDYLGRTLDNIRQKQKGLC